MSDHTPGPWDIIPPLDKNSMAMVHAPALEQAEPWTIAYVLTDNNPNQREIDEANARLIAAAPELLAACQAAVQYLEHPAQFTECQPAYGLLRGSINKALKGRP